MADEIRIGILGAARIARTALIAPARAVDGVVVAAVAARSGEQARAFADEHAIPRWSAGYGSVLADPGIDAVYIPLPNGLHGHWALEAIRAGKHVLCEKPFTANAEEARAVADAADGTGLTVMEAFHYRYHPLTARVLEIVRSGAIGDLESVRATLCAPIPPGRNIRWQPSLAGGTMMDLGCYAVHMLRTVAGAEPAVASARAKVVRGGIDRAMRAELAFPGGVAGGLTVSMWSARLLSLHLDIGGTGGRIRVRNPLSPQHLGRITVTTGAGRISEATTRRPSYEFQLSAFRDAIRGGAAPLTDPVDAVRNMRVVDDVYRAAGMTPRQPARAV